MLLSMSSILNRFHVVILQVLVTFCLSLGNLTQVISVISSVLSIHYFSSAFLIVFNFIFYQLNAFNKLMLENMPLLIKFGLVLVLAALTFAEHVNITRNYGQLQVYFNQTSWGWYRWVRVICHE